MKTEYEHCRKGDLQFTVERRTAEITVDLVLQARAKMSDNKGQRTWRCDCKRDDQAVAFGENLHLYEVFSRTLLGKVESPSSWKIVKLIFLRKPDAEPKKRDQKLQGHCPDIGDVEVTRVLYCSSSGKGKRTCELEEFTHWRGRRDKLPASAS